MLCGNTFSAHNSDNPLLDQRSIVGMDGWKPATAKYILTVYMYDKSVRKSMGQCQVQAHKRQVVLMWLV